MITLVCTQKVVTFEIFKLGVLELFNTLLLSGLGLVGLLATGLSTSILTLPRALRNQQAEQPFLDLHSAIC